MEATVRHVDSAILLFGMCRGKAICTLELLMDLMIVVQIPDDCEIEPEVNGMLMATRVFFS